MTALAKEASSDTVRHAPARERSIRTVVIQWLPSPVNLLCMP